MISRGGGILYDVHVHMYVLYLDDASLLFRFTLVR